MSLKDKAAALVNRKFGPPPPESAAFLDDLSEAVEKPVQPPKAAAQSDTPQTPKAAGERVGRKSRAKSRGDVRSLNATERDIQFSTRIDADLDLWIFQICERRKGKLRRNQRYGLADFLEDAALALDREDGVSRETA